jgi:hypothetical protein
MPHGLVVPRNVQRAIMQDKLQRMLIEDNVRSRKIIEALAEALMASRLMVFAAAKRTLWPWNRKRLRHIAARLVEMDKLCQIVLQDGTMKVMREKADEQHQQQQEWAKQRATEQRATLVEAAPPANAKAKQQEGDDTCL